MNFYSVLKYILSAVFLIVVAVAYLNMPDEAPSQPNQPQAVQPAVPVAPAAPGQSKFNL